MENNKHHNVAIVYHYWAQYREAVATQLSRQNLPLPRYTLYSGVTTEIRIKTINPEKANLAIVDGGLRWRIIKNHWIIGPFLWQRGLVKLAFSSEFDVIIFLGSMYHLSTWVSAVIARMRGKRVLMWTHGFYNQEKGIKGGLRNIFYRLANGVILYGNYAKDIMISRGFDEKSLYVVYNSLDYFKQLEVRRNIEKTPLSDRGYNFFENENPIIIFIGRLTKQKKLNLLIEACYRLKKENIQVNVLFVGGGEEREGLGQLVDKYNMANMVNFYGECYEEDEIGPLIYGASLCVSPGEVGLTAMHSLVYGTPVVTHDNFEEQMPEFEAIVDGSTGLFFKNNNINDLKEKIRAWLTLNKDRDEVRDRCYHVIDKYYNPMYQIDVFNRAVCGQVDTRS